MKIYNTIIIGGGMAGLGCARTLTERNEKDFLLISKDIGGRVPTSKDGQVNYGAYYARSDYRNLKPFLRWKKRMHLRDYHHCAGGKTFPITRTLWRHPFAAAKLFLMVLWANWHYQRFKRRCTIMSVKEAMESDPQALWLYRKPATEFIREYGLECLEHTVLNPILLSTGFLDSREMPAGGVLLCMLLMVYRTYEFSMDFEKIIAPFFEKISHDEVVSITRINDHWQVKTALGHTHHSQSLVMATPIHITKRLLSLDLDTNTGIDVHMVHVRGKLKHPYDDGSYQVFTTRVDDLVLARQVNGTCLLYSRTKDYDLGKYFSEYEIIAKRYWNPAFTIGGKLIDFKYDNDLFVIGDHHMGGMEDTFITGIYAANQILLKKRQETTSKAKNQGFEGAGIPSLSPA